MSAGQNATKPSRCSRSRFFFRNDWMVVEPVLPMPRCRIRRRSMMSPWSLPAAQVALDDGVAFARGGAVARKQELSRRRLFEFRDAGTGPVPLLRRYVPPGIRMREAPLLREQRAAVRPDGS